MVQIKGLPLPGIPCCPGASQSSQSANAAVALLLLAPSGASTSTAVRRHVLAPPVHIFAHGARCLVARTGRSLPGGRWARGGGPVRCVVTNFSWLPVLVVSTRVQRVFFYFFVTFRDCQRSFSDPAAFEVDVKSLLAKSFYCSHLIVVAFELHFDICIIWHSVQAKGDLTLLQFHPPDPKTSKCPSPPV